MTVIPLIELVLPDSVFIDAYNEIASQRHPVPLAYKFLEISEIIEKEQEKYKAIYDQKVKECTVVDEDIIQLDPVKQKEASEQMTKFCKETMISLPTLTREEIAHATIEPERLRLLKSWNFIQ